MDAETTAFPLVELGIRGKRSRRVSKSTSAKDKLRKRGRPLKHVFELAITKKRARAEALEDFKQQKSVMTSSEPKYQVSELERLPVELIQQIFLHSLELNLPRASTSLARSLSKESIYSSLLLLAFFDDDGQHPVDKKLFAPAQYRELDLAEKLRLQSSILNSRWCTLDRLQQHLPALSRLAMIQAWHEEHDREFRSDIVSSEGPLITPSLPLREVARLPSLNDLEATEQHFLARSLESPGDKNGEINEPNLYLPRIRTWTSSKGKDGRTYKTIDAARGVLNVRHIPDRLLRGSPWTPEKLAFLKLVRQGWRFLQKDFVLQISPVAMFDGMASAIAQSDAEALTVLLELHFSAFQDEASNTSVTASGRVRHAISFTHPIPIELFHLATRQKNSGQLIGLLLREGIGSIYDDAVLTKWALAAHGSGVATWLLRHMEGTEDYGLGLNRSSLFVNGNMTWRRTAGKYPFPEISFTDELGYLKDGAVDFRPQRIDNPVNTDGFERSSVMG